MKHQIVKDWMTDDIVVISPQTSLLEIHAIMLKVHIRHLPVIENNHLIGIISQGDMRSAVSLTLSDDGSRGGEITAEEIMTPDPITISSTANIDQAAELMLTAKISGLPVLDDTDYVVGIITETDILRLVVQHWRDI